MTDLDVLLADIAAEPELREVFLAMPTQQDEFRPYARQQARDCGLTIERWRHHSARLIALGLATYGPVVNLDDGRPNGSTYWLTQRGTDLHPHVEGVPA